MELKTNKDNVLEFLDNHKYSDPIYNRFLFTGSTISRENHIPYIPIDTDTQSPIPTVNNSAVLSQGVNLEETPLSDISQPSPNIPSLSLSIGLSEIYHEQPPDSDDDSSSTISSTDHNIIASTESEYIGDYESSDSETTETDSVL